MKAKFVWVILLALSLCACDDNTQSMGMGVLPGGDKVTVGSMTFDVTTRSVLSGPIFAKTNIGYIGKFTDPDFGFYESSFLTQLHSVDSLRFPEVYDRETKTGEMAGDSIYLAELIISYTNYFGDSLSTCHLSVYELNKDLDKSYYTDITPEEFYNPEDLLGEQTYTAVDLSIDESIRNSSSFVPYVRVPLPKSIGERIYRANREHPEYFYEVEDFIENVCKGVYIKCDQGDGTILYADEVRLNVVYPCFELDTLNNIVQDSLGRDSINYQKRSFVATKEVIQANRFTNSDKLQEKVREQDWTYIKSPAGIQTEVTLPIQQIANELSKDTLNAVRLTFASYVQSSGELFSMDPPSYLLLIREKEVKNFFENNQLTDNKTSFYSTLSSTNTKAYEFNNLSNLITACISEKEEAKKEAGSDWNEQEWEEENAWNKVRLIPVVITIDSQKNLINVLNDMKPGYTKLVGGENNTLELKVNYTTFK